MINYISVCVINRISAESLYITKHPVKFLPISLIEGLYLKQGCFCPRWGSEEFQLAERWYLENCLSRELCHLNFRNLWVNFCLFFMKFLLLLFCCHWARTLAPPPLCTFIQQKLCNNKTTRSALRVDCVVPIRSSSFGQLFFSVRASKLWNQLPVEIRNCTSHHTFTHRLKDLL